MRIGDELEIRGPGERALWYKGRVNEVDGSRVLVESYVPDVDAQWLETSSELICKLGSHIDELRRARRRAAERKYEGRRWDRLELGWDATLE